MSVVRPKKTLGQHFLADNNIARKIVGSLSANFSNLLEIGPGMGMLTQYLIENKTYRFIAIDVDRESVDYLQQQYPQNADKIILDDFLKSDLGSLFDGQPFAIIGNFPYNISSQIFFKVMQYRNHVPEVVGMIQKEVAERIAAPPGSKTYGIMSVLLQAWYHIEYLFTVGEQVFIPPPKVKSAVIRLYRNNTEALGCNEQYFVHVVKTAFNQRRKMIRNSLKCEIGGADFSHPYLEQRPEQLSVGQFVELTNALWNLKNS